MKTAEATRVLANSAAIPTNANMECAASVKHVMVIVNYSAAWDMPALNSIRMRKEPTDITAPAVQLCSVRTAPALPTPERTWSERLEEKFHVRLLV